jgi:hypothetical protein
LIDNELDAVLLDTNAAIAMITAVTVPGENRWMRAKRAAVALGTFGASRVAADTLEENVSKEAPDGSDDAFGSHHAIEPFAGSAVTRRNVEEMRLSPWARYSIIGASYTCASLAALTRVQQAGHSFADQLMNAALGNFIGIFLSDAFILENSSIAVAISGDRVYLDFKMIF